MSTSVITNYAFMYFVLFLIVPLLIVSFTLTCIKFFKNESIYNIENLTLEQLGASATPHFSNKQVLNQLHDLNALAKDKYDILYGVNLDEVIEVKNNDELKEVLHQYKMNYVVIDHKSSEIKLVITDNEHNENRAIRNIFRKLNINHINVKPNQPYDFNLIKTALAA
ncbi:DUF2726 domain-containing protein [Shewanella sp. SNU WT4]|uniref:DUF2726 domain-containing protein n=1 Tax=Shewanella sp. SNU WT4 TaxID=2590015 RepID=UPI00112C5421|nr:DUF2726 domain-containing protein [Shewanella sp. SNU WT4]QDF65767.1 DUF2726 domain-containing protein [Shewanella sp. SNU WT4]